MKLAVVVPAHNEEKNILKVIKALKQQKQINTIIIVDDHSSDSTVDKLLHEDVDLVLKQKNEGYGAALLSGINRALELNATHIITFDGDNQHNAYDIPKLVQEADNADVVIASRFLLDGAFENASNLRKYAIKFINFHVWFASNLKLTDTQCGFRLYNAHVFDKRFPLNCTTMGFSVELPLKLKAMGYTFTEVPTTARYHADAQRSTKSLLRQFLDVNIAILKTLGWYYGSDDE